MPGLSSAGEAATLAPLTSSAYVSLHTADPANTGASEVSGGGYARQGAITFANAGNNPTVASNTTILSFPTATANWGTINYFGIWTAVSGGTFLGSGTLTTPRVINNGDMVRFAIGALTISAN